jgi:S1-C subfamily serine protease
VTRVDWVAVAFVAFTALLGLRRGLVASALSLAGLVVGAIVGSRIAPHLLPGSHSAYTPIAALVGAAVGAGVLEAAASMAGKVFRQGLRIPPLRLLDSAGGLVLGAFAGLAIVWVIGAVALYLPGQKSLRRGAQRSEVLEQLNRVVAPDRLLSALSRVDPFPSIAAPLAAVAPPTAAVLRVPGVRAAAPSVVRVLGTACGLGIEGSGWVARPGLVVTAAHVVAGERSTSVERAGSAEQLDAKVVGFDPRNDVAVLRVRGLRARPLPLVEPHSGEPVAIVGFPDNGPLDAAPGRIGRTAALLSEDAYGHGPILRTITTLRGRVRHGNSGSPAIDPGGNVQATIFAARIGAEAGFGVPASVVRHELDAARRPVSTGGCAP